MSSTIKLLPCPFCSNADISIKNENPKDNSGGYFIECPGCGASTSLRFACGDDPTSLLAEQWNRRATSHCLHQIQEPAAVQAAPAAVAVPATPWREIGNGMPEWTDDSSIRVIVVTADEDFGGVQIHDVPASDFHRCDPDDPADPEDFGTEVTRSCTHWAYRDEIWPRAALAATPAAAPAGWKLVPEVPTDDMIRAFRERRTGGRDREWWPNVLASAPVHPAVGVPGRDMVSDVTDEQIDAILDSQGGMDFVIADKRQRMHLFARRVLALAVPAATPAAAAPVARVAKALTKIEVYAKFISGHMDRKVWFDGTFPGLPNALIYESGERALFILNVIRDMRALLAGVSAPAAQAVEVDDQMALTFHHAITDGSIGQDDLNEIKIGLRAVLANVQAGARDAERMAAFADAAHQGNEAFERAMHTFRERRDGETGLEYMRSMIDAAIAAQAAQQGGAA